MLQESPFGIERDIFYMQEALKQANIAATYHEVPIGAVIVNTDGIMIAQTHNLTEQHHSQVAHAELQAIARAGQAQTDWRLTGCWLYVTLEPCIMCMGCIYLSRLTGIVYGAASPLFGTQLDNAVLLPVYKVNALRIIAGLCAKESEILLKTFFRAKRDSNNGRR